MKLEMLKQAPMVPGYGMLSFQQRAGEPSIPRAGTALPHLACKPSMQLLEHAGEAAAGRNPAARRASSRPG